MRSNKFYLYFILFVFVFVVYCGFRTGVVFAQDSGDEFLVEEETIEGLFIYNNHGKRDPFQQLVDQNGQIIKFGKELSVTDLNLEGIMTGEGGKNVAIINGLVVRLKDNLGPFVVTKITDDSVVLKKGQDLITLKLKKEEAYE